VKPSAPIFRMRNCWETSGSSRRKRQELQLNPALNAKQTYKEGKAYMVVLIIKQVAIFPFTLRRNIWE
jgi:hypothetical protein